MEKCTKQLLIGSVIVVVAAAALFWFLRVRASSLSCHENPGSAACWHVPGSRKNHGNASTTLA